MARNAPEAFAQHEADTAKLMPMRAKDAYVLDQDMGGPDDAA